MSRVIAPVNTASLQAQVRLQAAVALPHLFATASPHLS
jgi:hypothetical protein